MSNEKRKFVTLDESFEVKVFTASDQRIKSCGIGEITLDVKQQKHESGETKKRDLRAGIKK